MTIISKLLVGGAAIAAFAVPAAAQTYPYAQPQYPPQGYAYPQAAYPQQAYPQTPYGYPQQGYPQPGYAQPGYAYPQQQQQGGLAGLIGQLLGARNPAVNERAAITRCATAAQMQARAQYRPNAYGQAYPGQNGYGYNGHAGYANAATARVTGITNVQRSSNGLRVSGTMSSGAMMAGAPYGYGAQGYGNQGYGAQGYNPAYGQAASDLSFRCNVDYRGAVTNLRIRPIAAYRR